MHDPFMTVPDRKGLSSHPTWYVISTDARSRGLSMRVKTNGTGVPVRSSIFGQVVWSGLIRRAMPPLDGSDRGRNDQSTWVVMVRDEWGFVHQFFGIDEQRVHVHVGKHVSVGTVLGFTPSEPLSAFPPSTAPPADVPKRFKEEGYEAYPYRFRKLEIRVARPHPSWTSYSPPDADGWTYFNPLLMYVAGRQPPHMIRPFSAKQSLVFASFDKEPIPHALPLSQGVQIHRIPAVAELFVSFQPFIESPGDPSDAMDPVSLYSLEWAAEPVERIHGSLCAARDVYWRRSFEHSRLASEHTAVDDPFFLHAHYVPSVFIGMPLGNALHVRRNSQFDEKNRWLLYAVTRNVLGHPHVGGAWNTTREKGHGRYRIAVRARSLTSAHSCVEEDVLLSSEARRFMYAHIFDLVPIMFTRNPLPFFSMWVFDQLNRIATIVCDALR